MYKVLSGALVVEWFKREEGRLATHMRHIQVIFIAPFVGSIDLTWKVLPTAVLEPIETSVSSYSASTPH